MKEPPPGMGGGKGAILEFPPLSSAPARANQAGLLWQARRRTERVGCLGPAIMLDDAETRVERARTWRASA